MPSGTTIVPEAVVVHPLVLLSVVDHYNRVALNTKRRVVGVLLGQWNGRIVNVTNSFALPFEEDEKDPKVWFLDHNYHETMSTLFKKVNSKERPVGWYHSGPKLRQSDLEINELFKKYCANPVLVIIDVKPKDLGLPTDAYVSVEEIHDDGTATSKTFAHVTSLIEAEEAEEIGVEHLLRDIKDNAVSNLSSSITNQVQSLKALNIHLRNVEKYLERVVNNELPVNHPVLYRLQDAFNCLPNIQEDLVKAFAVNMNDNLLMIYLSSIARSIISLHNLIDNKIENKNAEVESNKK